MKWLLLIPWSLLWGIGGILLAYLLFHLPRREAWPVGMGIGLVVSTWLTNWLARLLTLPLAGWTAGALVFAAALGLTLIRKRAFPIRPGILIPGSATILALLCLTSLFTLTGRGLGIFDDYQNLPTVSSMAAGDIPPHFVLNPDVRFGYHYFLLLIAAQVMRLGGLAPWDALDLTRGFVLAITLLLAGLLTYRLTRSLLAQWISIWFVALSGGIRWLLLLTPARLLKPLSDHIHLIGSGAQSGETLTQALTAAWAIEGGGTFAFPFAFVSGLNQPWIMGLGGFGVIHAMLILLLLLTAGRERKTPALFVTVILLAALALSNEVTFTILYAGLGLTGLGWLLLRRRWQVPATLLRLVAICLVALLLALIQGGMFTEMAGKWLGAAESPQSSYYEVGFHLTWPPQFISAHLGPLYLINPAHLIIALLEIGPVILMLPLLLAWGWKAFKRQRWLEAGLAASALVSLLMVFVTYEGTAGVTATGRLYGNLFIACTLYAVPLAWLWARRKGQSAKAMLLGVAGLSAFAGSVLLSIQLLAAPQPLYAPFVTNMDRTMFIEHWNRLEGDWLVFDPLPPRSPTLFGQPTRSNVSWYRSLPEWTDLVASPNPHVLQAAGFGYIYTDKDYRKEHKDLLDDDCIRLIRQVDGSKRQYNGIVPDYRQLLDIRGCK